MARIIGLDPASTKFGYGVIDVAGLRLTYVECGVILASPHAPKYARLASIWRDLQAVLDEFQPTEAAIEAGFVRGEMGALVSGAARGIGALACELRGLAVSEYAPTAVKKSVTCYGAASKDSVARMVKLTLGLKLEPEPDAADALATAICHARRPTGVLIRR
jgi:crossover junction endodeoxyribonuclease RuvC